MSENFDACRRAIGEAVSNEEKKDALLVAIEAVTEWRHIRILCGFASFIKICPEVDKTLCAKAIVIDREEFGQRKDSTLRISDFLPGITLRLDPKTETHQWATIERGRGTSIPLRSTVPSRARA